MKFNFFYPLCLLCCLLQSSVATGQGLESHSAYKITSYNLGPILEFEENNLSFRPEKSQPLLITGSTSDILTNEFEGAASWVETEPHASNTNSIAFSAQFNPNARLSFQGAFGVTRNLWTPDSVDYQQESSWEANLGVVYKFLGNISYELHLGYMDTGNLFTERNSYSDVESIIMVSNKLTLSF
jgi:hypothetical protein